MTDKSIKLRMMIVTSLFAAIISVLAQISIPMPLGVPITGQTLAIGLAATILGSRYGTLSAALYMLIGTIGVPVFAQLQGGPGVIMGPTGGFIVGFIPSTFIIGYILERTKFTVGYAVLANIVGMFITLLFGTFWLKYAASFSWTVAFAGGFTPFIIGGFIKALIAAIVGLTIRERLVSANLLHIN